MRGVEEGIDHGPFLGGGGGSDEVQVHGGRVYDVGRGGEDRRSGPETGDHSARTGCGIIDPVAVPSSPASWSHAMSLRHHEIAEANHRILDPFTDEKLRLLGEVCGVGPGTRILDLACGKGEMLSRWAEWFGSGGLGVDLSPVFLAAAVARAAELGVDDRVSFVQGDAGAFAAEAGAYDIASCLGATWIGNGIAGTMALLRPAIRDGGLLVVGEPYLIEEPPAEAFAAWGFGPGEYTSLAGTAERLEACGLELREMVLADPDSWDRYEAQHWGTIADWLEANPDDPDHATMRGILDRDRATYLRWGRRYLGWGVFVTRPT
jgi:SAM-dependent methyltransferase